MDNKRGPGVVAGIARAVGKTDQSIRALLSARRTLPTSIDRFKHSLSSIQIGDPPAKILYNQILAMAAEFEATVPDDLSMVGVFALPGGEEILVNGIAYVEPNMITFSGVDHLGCPARVLVSAGSTTLLFRTFPKDSEESRGRRIGFHEVRAGIAVAGGAPDAR